MTPEQKAALAMAQMKVVMALNILKGVGLKLDFNTVESKRLETIVHDITNGKEGIDDLAKAK